MKFPSNLNYNEKIVREMGPSAIAAVYNWQHTSGMDKLLHILYSVEWNYLSIPTKVQLLSLGWSHT